MPANARLYRYRSRSRARRTMARVATKAAIPHAVQTAWRRASWVDSRAMNTYPIPLSSPAVGSRMGSALGANRRMAR